MRCKLCCKFFRAREALFNNDQQLRVMYRKRFKSDHVVGWIRTALQAMSSKRNLLKCKTHPDFLELPGRKKDNEGTPTARTVTQEHPIVRGRAHVCRVAIPRDTMSAPM